MYSQGDEERVILEYFGYNRKGRFLDVGAFDGEWLSNTRALAERGWGGVLIEPDSSVFSPLAKRYQNHPSIHTVNGALTTKPGLCLFHTTGGAGLSSLNYETTRQWTENTFWPIYVVGFTWLDLINTFGNTFDFISIDAEGTDLALFDEAPLERMNTELVCVEAANSKHDELAAHMTARGFEEIHRTPQNVIARRKA